MAAVALMPRVRIMAICDGVRESKIEAGVFNLKGVRQGITADAFPFTPSRLWLFLLLSSPRPGVFPGYVRVVNEQTDKIVFYAHLQPHPTFEEDNASRHFPHKVLFSGGRPIHGSSLVFSRARKRCVERGNAILRER